jgi:leucyl aminopeptidase
VAPVYEEVEMPVEILPQKSAGSRPVYLVEKGDLESCGLNPTALAWTKANNFTGEAGKTLILPGRDGEVAGALLGLGKDEGAFAPLLPGALAKALPEGDWHFAATPADPGLAALGLLLGSYRFTRYAGKPGRNVRFSLPEEVSANDVRRIGDSIFLVRDLINTPTNEMGPPQLEMAVRSLAERHGAKVAVSIGDELLEGNFPMIHAVGRASTEAPRLIDMVWGPQDAPKVTLVGKGVCFDTGGLDIKPASAMLLMKKDMGGAANVLGLASMVMDARIRVRLRVLIPAVENAISGSAFRPGDVLRSRRGLTVEIGNTDAEGRLILADALALADEESPQLLVDMATLTGAARVALGPDLAPYYTGDEALAGEIEAAAAAVADPVWRMPLWKPYASRLSSKVADTNNVTSDSFAGSVTAALFLQRFVEKAASWAHFDIFGWHPSDRPHGPTGGEAQGVRALERVIARKFA